MSRSLKVKLFFSGVSLLVLILIPLLESNFYAPVTMVRWRQLAWDDFQGIAKPFTGWGAGIVSNIYTELDSVQNRYVSYASMNNQRSWTKESSIDSEYLLSHEQYHFNISEFFARKLNQIIRDKNLTEENEINDQLIVLRAQLNTWQDQYDEETDHSINRPTQRRWEFRIDSLLSKFTIDSGYVSDYYSGCRAFLPTNVELHKGTNNDGGYTFRSHRVYRYGMFLALATFQYFEEQSGDLAGQLFKMYREDSVEFRSIRIDSVNYNFHGIFETYDSVLNQTTAHRWIRTKDYMYKLTAIYPGDSIPEYKSIAHSFIMSFETIDNKGYWMRKFQTNEVLIGVSEVQAGPIDENDDGKLCWSYDIPKPVGFYGKPIISHDRSVLIPYCVTYHADSLVEELMVVDKKNRYSSQPSSESFLYLPGEDISADGVFISIGYTVKGEAATNGCLKFFNQAISVSSK